MSDESDEEEISNLNSTVHSHASAIVTAYLQEARISVEIKEKQEAERKLTDVSQLEERLLSCEKDLNSHRWERNFSTDYVFALIIFFALVQMSKKIGNGFKA